MSTALLSTPSSGELTQVLFCCTLSVFAVAFDPAGCSYVLCNVLLTFTFVPSLANDIDMRAISFVLMRHKSERLECLHMLSHFRLMEMQAS